MKATAPKKPAQRNPPPPDPTGAGVLEQTSETVLVVAEQQNRADADRADHLGDDAGGHEDLQRRAASEHSSASPKRTNPIATSSCVALLEGIDVEHDRDEAGRAVGHCGHRDHQRPHVGPAGEPAVGLVDQPARPLVEAALVAATARRARRTRKPPAAARRGRSKKPHHAAGPAEMIENVKIPYSATIGEMNAKARAKIAQSENSRLRPSLLAGGRRLRRRRRVRALPGPASRHSPLFRLTLAGRWPASSILRRSSEFEQEDDRTKAESLFDASSEPA